MNNKGLLILGMIALIGFNATKAAAAYTTSAPALQKLDTSIVYLGPKKRLLDPKYLPHEVVLRFPYIAGGLFGKPNGAPLFVQVLSGKQSFSLDLKSVEKELSENARPLKSEWIRRGLTIAPSDTRLARIGTFAYDAKTRKGLGAGGFIDTKSNDFLILLYVDRVCHISGLVQDGQDSVKHNIYFASPGFHWVHVITVKDNVYILEEYRGERDVKFFIQLMNRSPI